MIRIGWVVGSKSQLEKSFRKKIAAAIGAVGERTGGKWQCCWWRHTSPAALSWFNLSVWSSNGACVCTPMASALCNFSACVCAMLELKKKKKRKNRSHRRLTIGKHKLFIKCCSSWVTDFYCYFYFHYAHTHVCGHSSPASQGLWLAAPKQLQDHHHHHHYHFPETTKMNRRVQQPTSLSKRL